MIHAFLIIAHDNFPLLKRLLRRLDSPNSNIYIHIDKKLSLPMNYENELRFVVKFAKVVCIPRDKVTWGGYSLIQCTLNLLKTATKDCNDYYHLLSGHDYPLVGMKAFNEFFTANNGMEFIGFSRQSFADKEKQRYSVYYFFQDMVSKKKAFYGG